MITIGMAFVLWRVWLILGHVERLSNTVSEQGALLRADIVNAREKLGQIMTFSLLTKFFAQTAKRVGAVAAKRPKKESHKEARGDEESN